MSSDEISTVSSSRKEICHHRGQTRIRWSARPDGLEESVQFTPGYNCPERGPLGHGVHGMEIRWMLRGPAGAVWLAMFTDWIPGERTPGHGLPPHGPYDGWKRYPDGGGLGYHARVPQYEGHEVDRENCDLIGGPCYGDMSYSGADAPVERFVVDGEQAIWDALEAHYVRLSASWDVAQQLAPATAASAPESPATT